MTKQKRTEAQDQPEAPAKPSRNRKARATDAVEAAEELAPAPEDTAAANAPAEPAAGAGPAQGTEPGAEPGTGAGTEAGALPAAETWPESEEEWATEVEAAYLQSKYTLVSVAAKRARQLLAGSKRRVDSLSEKPVTVALEELAAGKLYFERTRDGIK